MNIGRIRGKERPEEEEELAGAVGRGVEKSAARHVKGILQARVSLRLLVSEGLKFSNVVVWVARHVAHTDGETIAHADDAELGDGVLFEELGDKLLTVAEGEEIACRTEVFLGHGGGEVNNQDEMANYTSLERSGIFEESERLGY